jgi:hypothetical protein
MTDTKKTSRELLLDIGMGKWNTTGTIPYLMIAPATTDPKSPQVMEIVRHLQQVLFGMGATDVANTGYLDPSTARALRQLVGPNWERMTWAANISGVLAARRRGQRLSAASLAVSVADDSVPVAVGGPLDFLPDVPGGLITYGVIGYLIYRHFQKKRAS